MVALSLEARSKHQPDGTPEIISSIMPALCPSEFSFSSRATLPVQLKMIDGLCFARAMQLLPIIATRKSGMPS